MFENLERIFRRNYKYHKVKTAVDTEEEEKEDQRRPVPHLTTGTRIGCLVFLAVVMVAIVASLLHRAESPLFNTTVKGVETEFVPVGDPSDECSCWNSNTSRDCCRRVIIHYHKMGTQLMRELIKDQYRLKDGGISYVRELPDVQEDGDFRAIETIRNFYDAIVSGYLYHKSGKECWLTMTGKPLRSSKNFANRRDWDRWLENPAPYAPPKNRNLCKYLSEESEQDGLRVIMELLFVFWWRDIKEYFETSNDPHHRNYGRIQHVCYEDFVNDVTQHASMQRVVKFLFPGGDDQIASASHNISGAGGHATSTDKDLRQRVREMVEQLDKEYFQNTVAWHQQAFRCGE